MGSINFFGRELPLYGIIIAIGLIVGNIVVYRDIHRRKQNFDDFILIETYGLAFGWLGAKILYLWVSRGFIEWNRIGEVNYLIYLMKNGFVFYGGLIGGVIGIIIAKFIHKIDLKMYLSELVYCIPLVHGFGRIGCFHAGCCFGMPYNGPLAIVYNDPSHMMCGIKLFPVQLLSALILFSFAFIFYILIKKKGSSIEFFLGYIMTYSIARFLIEFLRYDSIRGGFWIFSTSQWISISIFIILLARVMIKNHQLKLTS